MRTIRFFDLFSGIGGFRLGGLQADVKGSRLCPVGACDSDPLSTQLYESIFHPKKTEMYFSDVFEVNTMSRRSKTSLPPFDLLLAGFPCQPFANVGLRRGFADERAATFSKTIKIIEMYRPAFFILENVQKLAVLNRGAVLQRMRTRLRKTGYNIHIWDLCASNYGVPQQRRRIFLCGANQDLFDKLELGAPLARHNKTPPTAWHLLERTMEEKHIVPAQTRRTVFRKNPKWQGDLEIDRPIARPLCATMAKWHRANQDNYYSETYVMGYYPDLSRPVVNMRRERIRRITPLEGLRLQGFPENISKAIVDSTTTLTGVYRVIGNAVPVPLARAVIEHLVGSYIMA